MIIQARRRICNVSPSCDVHDFMIGADAPIMRRRIRRPTRAPGALLDLYQRRNL